MKITITLSPEEVKGIKAYLKETDGDINPKTDKAAIKRFIEGELSAVLHAPHSSVSDYIRIEELKA